MRMTDTPENRPASTAHISLYDAAVYADGEPHACWRVLREQCPVLRETAPDGTPFWSITKHRDVARVLRDTAVFSSAHSTMLSAMHGDPAQDQAIHLMDPPRHGQLRRPTVGILSKRVMAERRQLVRERLRELVGSGVRQGEVDFAELVMLLPMAVAGDIIGIPRQQWEQTAHWTLASVAPEDPAYAQGSPEDTLMRAHVYLLTMFEELVAERRRHPASDLISLLTEVEVDGQPLSDQDVVVNCYAFLIGSNITTPQVASHLALVMANEPKLWHRIRTDQTLMSTTVEEMLRWSTPTNHLLRRTTTSATIGDQTLPAGALVCAWIASANRDDEVFSDPFVFDPARRPNRHLAFGFGAHRCVGDVAARLGLSVLLEQLVEQVEDFHIIGPVRHLRSNFLNGVGSLPVRLGPAGRERAQLGTTVKGEAVVLDVNRAPLDGSDPQHGRLAAFGGPPAVPSELRSLPWPVVTDADRAAVLATLDTGRLVSDVDGESAVSKLEQRWAEFCDTAYCVATSNGTTALATALAALGVGPGDEVIVPALSFIASALAPLHQLAVPVFVDVDPVTFTMDPRDVAARITSRTAAIMPVHMHGHPADMTAIGDLAQQHGIAVVEDAAQAHGAHWEGRPLGSFGQLAAFSLQVTKNLPTCGEGGLLTTSDQQLAMRAQRIRQFGEDIEPGRAREYRSHRLGWNHKMNAVQAAFALSQLERFADYEATRQRQVPRFLARIAELPGITVPTAPARGTHAWHILRLRLDPAAAGMDDVHPARFRQAVQRLLRAEGVPVSRYQVLPLPEQPVFTERIGYGNGYPWVCLSDPPPAQEYPVTRAVIADSLTLQKRHLHPEAEPALRRYADGFEKVWEQLTTVAVMAKAKR